MQLNEILNIAEIVKVIGKTDNVSVDKLTIDSREVSTGSIFFAIKGFKLDGTQFIADAINNNAVAIVFEEDVEAETLVLSSGKIGIVVNNARKSLAEFSSIYYGNPSGKLTLVGITGTKGKTTTSYYLKNIFETAGYKTGLIGTNKNMVGSKEIPTSLTTPESHKVNELLAQMVDEGCTHCVMEVSSHALELYRVDKLLFDCAIFTNLTSDHMDFHETKENYLKAKKKLFDMLGDNSSAVLNSDDESYKALIADSKAVSVTYGTIPQTDFSVSNINYGFEGTTFTISNNNNNYSCSTSLVGKFNAYNAAAALSAAVELGISHMTAVKGIKDAKQIAGRFEVINKNKRNVIIDFSHTADSLYQALTAVNEIANNTLPRPEIITVFGCGGNRDKTKRPIMGGHASSLSDLAIVTSDNPRDEDPNEIIKDILTGISKDNFKVIADREKAIEEAILNSGDNSVILIAGKGHEEYQLIKGAKTHFSDKELAEKYLELCQK